MDRCSSVLEHNEDEDDVVTDETEQNPASETATYYYDGPDVDNDAEYDTDIEVNGMTHLSQDDIMFFLLGFSFDYFLEAMKHGLNEVD